MEGKEAKVKELTDIRFSWIIFLFRIAGIPFKMKKVSTLYAFYMVTVIICTCSTFPGMIFNVYIHMDDLDHVMTSIRDICGITSVLWIYFSCR
jgi:hypothetical protein